MTFCSEFFFYLTFQRQKYILNLFGLSVDFSFTNVKMSKIFQQLTLAHPNGLCHAD